MTVYVVTSGIYSDYGINHIFSSKELAIKWIGENSDYEIEEFELDPNLDFSENIKTSFGIDMLRDGTIKNVRGRDSFGAFEKKAHVRIWSNSYDLKESYLETTILTRDELVAIKTTNEIRHRLIALNRWPQETSERQMTEFDYETLEIINEC